MIYGLSTPRSGRVSVLGEVERTCSGNLVFRVGQEREPGGTWEQTEHVVLEPVEVSHLLGTLRDMGFTGPYPDSMVRSAGHYESLACEDLNAVDAHMASDPVEGSTRCSAEFHLARAQVFATLAAAAATDGSYVTTELVEVP